MNIQRILHTLVIATSLSSIAHAGPEAFPAVSADTQAQRDQTRQTILEQEIATEARALEVATKQRAHLLVNGDTAKAAAAQEAIDRAKRNIRELQREIALTSSSKTSPPTQAGTHRVAAFKKPDSENAPSPAGRWWNGYGPVGQNHGSNTELSPPPAKERQWWDGYGALTTAQKNDSKQTGVEADVR